MSDTNSVDAPKSNKVNADSEIPAVPPETINIPDLEQQVIALWRRLDAFRTSVRLAREAGRPRYTFYDGPPFATGLPHYGHHLAGTIKDVITRWFHQSGFLVERVFGWDCHGLPVEYEIDKTNNIHGPEDVAKLGIAEYNRLCRSIVMRYSNEWRDNVERMGRWIDFDNDYKTMYPWFMESVWWVFKQLYQKGLVYKGVKVMPFSTACSTPLSNFEAGQNYKDTSDPAVVVNFPIIDQPDVAFLAWTTTPWTLPSNLALCVHPDLDYVKVKDSKSGKTYILMEARLIELYSSPEEYTVLDKFKGKTLEGTKYEPLFNYFAHLRESRGAFRVLCDTYVTSDAGVGIVHQAPYFGEDDFRVCCGANIIAKDLPQGEWVCPVDAAGRFTAPVTDFLGLHVKEADKAIIQKLKERGRLVQQKQAMHSYPFCWRSDTPLIYKAVPSWFVRVEPFVPQLLQALEQTYWVPDFVKSRRFANWVADARDWAISRNRYWGTPIPIWQSEDGEETVCVGSIEELKQLTGVTEINDLHRESIDHLTIPSTMGKGNLKRITEILDCWFESGSMPYAQLHYPFNPDISRIFVEELFPADFIAEGIDQTRGWFYTLLVLSTLLFGKPPFKNIICNGLVLAEDGQKMSKRKKNYTDPMEIVRQFGADALRLYLVSSPAVRADNLRFKDRNVQDIVKDIFLPLYHSYRFLMQQLVRLSSEEGVEFTFGGDAEALATDNYMDRWILSYTQSLISFTRTEMNAYRLYTVLQRVTRFVENLTNWYVRMNRKRLKGRTSQKDCLNAARTLFSVIFSFVRIMSPFTPFLPEYIYQGLKNYIDPSALPDVSNIDSVHYLLIPEPLKEAISEDVEQTVADMQLVIDIGRVIRDRLVLPVKIPLRRVIIICESTERLNRVLSMKRYILEELNVKQIETSTDQSAFGFTMRADPDFKMLKEHFGDEAMKVDMKNVRAAVKDMTEKDLKDFLNKGSITVLDKYELNETDLRIVFEQKDAKKSGSQFEAEGRGNVLVVLDVSRDPEWLAEGLAEGDARLIVNRVQKMRKRAGLEPADPISILFQLVQAASSTSQKSAGEKDDEKKKENKKPEKAKEKEQGKKEKPEQGKEKGNANASSAKSALPPGFVRFGLGKTLQRFSPFIYETLLQPIYLLEQPLENPSGDSQPLVSETFDFEGENLRVEILRGHLTSSKAAEFKATLLSTSTNSTSA